jgi:ubiquinone/menaquinone biosynthesis C-methylase UbiE
MAAITLEDFKETFVRLWQRGPGYLFTKFSGNTQRTISTFDNNYSHANWWLLPQVQQELNKRMQIGGLQHYMQYAKYVYENWLKQKAPTILSVGCGNGSQELQWASLWPDANIYAFDITPKNIAEASLTAKEAGLTNLNFFVADWYKLPIQTYDVIVFHSSMHHLFPMPMVIAHLKQLMHSNSLLVINEYVGPNRIKHSQENLTVTNQLLATTPKNYRKIFKTPFYKIKAAAPGKWRMIFNDPSEAADSSAIRTLLEQHFKTLYQKELGGNVFVPYLKDIAHNFLNDTNTTQALLNQVFESEKVFMANQQSHFIFGLYQLK